jgi:hypothetical protein
MNGLGVRYSTVGSQESSLPPPRRHLNVIQKPKQKDRTLSLSLSLSGRQPRHPTQDPLIHSLFLPSLPPSINPNQKKRGPLTSIPSTTINQIKSLRRSARIPPLGHLLLALALQQPRHHAPLHLVLVPAVSPLRADAADVAGAVAVGRGRGGLLDAVGGDQGVVGVGVVVCSGAGSWSWVGS